MYGGFIIIFFLQLLLVRSFNLPSTSAIISDFQIVLEFISVNPKTAVIPSEINDLLSRISSLSSNAPDVLDFYSLYWLSLEKIVVDNTEFAGKLSTLSDEIVSTVGSVVQALKSGSIDPAFNLDKLQLQLDDLSIIFSEEAKEFYEKTILTNGRSTVDFLSRSPIARDTVAAIENVEQLLRSNILEQNKAILTEKIGKILQDVPQKPLDTVGANILAEFNKILDADPKLRFSSSEYVVDVYNNEVVPRATETAAFLARSPLAQNTKAVALTPTSKIAADLLAGLVDRTAQLSDSLGGIVAFQQQRVINALSALSASSVQSLGTIEIPNDMDIDISLRWQPSLALSPQVVADSVDSLSNLAVQVEKIAEELLPSLERGGVALSSELSKAGVSLVSNSASAAGSVGRALVKLGEDSVTIFPQRTAELILQDVLPTTSKTVAGTIAQAQTIEQQLLIGLSEAEAQTEQLLSAASRWQLFSDPNHLENGYWEKQLADATTFLQNWNEDSLPAIEKAAEDTYVAAVDRFGQIARRNTRLVELTDSAQSLLSTIRTLSDGLEENLKGDSEVGSARLAQLANEFQLQSGATVTLVSKLLSEVLSSLGTIGSQVSVDLPHYVEDFIVKGQDL